jgi:hypothetical protein
MTPTETVALLRLVRAVCPAQKLDEYTPDAWHELLGDLRLEDCNQALKALGQRQVFIAPAEIRQEVRRIRKDRLDRNPLPVPPSDMTPLETLAWQRETNKAIADGTYVPPALELVKPMPALPRFPSPNDVA